MALDNVVEEALKAASKKFGQTDDFAESLVNWLEQLSEQDLDDERNLQFLSVLKNKLLIGGE